MQTSDHRLEISVMRPADLVLALDWAAREGWNPGRHDAASFLAADPGGFYVGRLGAEPVAMISAVRYGTDFGFIGLYLVAPSHRGQGHGWALWQHAMASLDGRCVGLDGVLAQQDNYRRSGFRLAHRNIRMSGLRRRDVPVAAPSGVRLVDAAAVSPTVLAACDREHFPAPREGFLSAWWQQPDSLTRVALQADRVVGVGTVRTCHDGFKVGPLYAHSPEVAAALLDGLCAWMPEGAAWSLDVPEPNAAAVALARARGLSPSFETARMYTGIAPTLPLDRLYGITSFELG